MSDIAELFAPEAVQETVETSEVEVAEKVEATEAEKPEVKPEEEKPEVKKEEPTSSEESDKQEWTFAMAKDERQKRQKLEKELEELRAKYEKTDQAEMPDIFDDQKGFVKTLEERHQRELHNLRIDIYREAMIEANPDYEEKEAKFLEMAKESPILATQLRKAKNPAKFVYDQVKKYEQFEKLQDVDAYEKKLRAELEAKVLKEVEAKKQQEADVAESLSPSLAKARGAGADKEVSLPENPVDLF